MRIELDMYQTMAVAVLALMLGRYLRKKCWLLERFCIPAPVIGGVIFAVATCICYVTGIAEFVFDDILKRISNNEETIEYLDDIAYLKDLGRRLVV